MVKTLLIVLGLVFLLLVPPLQKPDEETHFMRSMALARGSVSCRTQQAQITVPQEYTRMISTIKKAIPEYNKPHTIPLSLYKQQVFLQSQKTINIQVESYCRFPVISYIPQVIGIYLGLLFSLNPYISFFLGRSMLFVVSVIWIDKLIKSSPNILSRWYTWVFCLPLFIHQATSYGYDAIPVLLFFTFFSHIWIMTTTQNLSVRNWATVGVLLLLFLLSRRGGYEPLAALFFLPLVPSSMKKRASHWWVGVIAIIGALFYITLLAANYASYGSSGMPDGAYPALQINLLQQHPQNILLIIARTLLVKTWFYMLSVVGTLGMLEYRVSAWIYALYALFFVYLTTSIKPEKKVSKSILLFIAGVVVLEIVYLLLLLYVTWTILGNSVVEGIQGRYFWPLIPLVGLILVQVRPWKIRIIKMPFYIQLLLVASTCASIAYTVVHRYFL